jgi:hypothetical protein
VSGSDKPYSPHCERNREPILQVLRRHLAGSRRVLEIGSGSGQHALYFAAALPQLTWQTSDVAANLPGIRAWLDEARLPNLPVPLTIDVNGTWPHDTYDAIYSANTFHIMSWKEVVLLFERLDAVLEERAMLVVYGPFNYNGRFTSDSNAAFDAQLRARSPLMGIRDFEAVDALARGIGLTLIEDCAMPANNRTLVWRRMLPAWPQPFPF